MPTRIAEGKITAEEFDAAFDSTPKSWYEQKLAEFDSSMESLNSLGEVCDGKFGDVTPSFGILKRAMEEVRQTVYILLQKKREAEPDAPKPQGMLAEEPAYEAPSEPGGVAPATPAYAGAAAAAPARAPVARRAAGPEPADREDAVARVVSAAKWLRTNDANDPAPYLLLRGLRWGELRATATLDPSLLAAPPTEIRQELKRLAADSQWAEVLETAETAMGMECGRGWLDLQRYAWRACSELGYEAIANAIRSGVRSLLEDVPDLLHATMMDDTPVANGETQNWIREHVQTAGQAREQAWAPPPAMEGRAAAEPGEEAAPDAFDLAMDAARSGRVQDGVEILVREMEQERCGRGRFQRKVQLAQLCLATGHDIIAQPILEELAGEIESRQLDRWEPGDVVAHPLALLYRSIGRNEARAEERQKLYARICRLDPVQALACAK